MKLIITADRKRMPAALALFDQEVVHMDRYDKPGWGWHYSRGDTTFFIRAIKSGLSITQTKPPILPPTGGESK